MKTTKFVLQSTPIFLPPLCFDIPCLIPTTSLVLAFSLAPSLYTNLSNVEKSLITLDFHNSSPFSFSFFHIYASVYTCCLFLKYPSELSLFCVFFLYQKTLFSFLSFEQILFVLCLRPISSRARLFTLIISLENRKVDIGTTVGSNPIPSTDNLG